MGCGESKHAVATTDSVTTRKGSNSRSSSRRSRQGDDNQPTGKSTSSSSRSSSKAPSRAPSRSTSMTKRLEGGDVNEKAVAENVEGNVAVEEKQGEVVEVKDGKEVGHDRTTSTESQNEYFSQASVYETPLHDGKDEKVDIVIKKEEEKSVEGENGEQEEAMVVEEKKQEGDQADKIADAIEAEGTKEAIRNEVNIITNTEDLAANEAKIEQEVTSTEAAGTDTTSEAPAKEITAASVEEVVASNDAPVNEITAASVEEVVASNDAPVNEITASNVEEVAPSEAPANEIPESSPKEIASTETTTAPKEQKDLTQNDQVKLV
ncbi:hypothetical protein Droror1_Dr00017272 [Drosera rotundifolia]